MAKHVRYLFIYGKKNPKWELNLDMNIIQYEWLHEITAPVPGIRACMFVCVNALSPGELPYTHY